MDIRKIAESFDFDSEIIDVRECSMGHINRTYFVETTNGLFVLQRINQSVFRNPEKIMANIVGISEHIRKKAIAVGKDPDRATMKIIKSGDKNYYYDDNGEFWRAYNYIDGDCYQACDSPELLRKAGKAFGAFQQQLSDYDASALFESIPDFHNTVKRYEALCKAIENDVVGRASECAAEIDFCRRHKSICGFIVDGIDSGKFPLRVTHNDTKLNNIIMDKETQEGLCVIDLDTVMPGSMLYDFGDAIRFGASSAAEDETDLSKVFVRPDLFEAFTDGFIEGLEGSATTEEIMAFPDSAIIITFEVGIRFLTDYLSGDTYFRTAYPKHNLDRARNQLKLVEDMENKRRELDEIVRKFLR